MKTARNAVWLTACRLSGDFLNLLLFVALSRQFGPAGVGVYSYGFAVTSFIYVVACLGIEEYGIRQYARMDEARRGTFMAELIGTQLIMTVLALIGLAIYVALTAAYSARLDIMLELTWYQIAAALAGTLFIPEMAHQRMARPALAELAARAAAFAAAGIAIYLLHASLAEALLGFPLGATLWLIMALRSSRRTMGPLRVTVSGPGVRGIVGVLWSFAILEIFWQLFTRIGVITLSLAQSDAAAGVFATGLRLIETALLPLSFLGVAFYPRLSQLFVTEPAAFQRQSGELIWLMLLIGGGVAWGLYFVAPSLLVPVLGARFAGSEPAIRAMAGLALVQAVEVGLGRVMLCADLQVPRAAFLAIGSVLSVVLNLIFVPRLGVSGAILAASAAYVVISALYLGVLRRPVSSSVLLPVMLTLGAILVAGAGTAGLLAAAGRAVWLQAAASAAVLLMVAGGCYLYRMRARVTAAPR